MGAYVMSGASYSSSLEVKGWKFGRVEVYWNWLQLMCCTYLQSRPGYFEQRLQIRFPECAGMQEVYHNGSEYKCEGESNGGSEF